MDTAVEPIVAPDRGPTGGADRHLRVPIRRPFDEPVHAAVTGAPGVREVNRPRPDGPSAVPASRPGNHEPTAPARSTASGPGSAAAAGLGDDRTAGFRGDREADLRAEIARLQALVEEKDQRAREAAVQARVAGEELERAKERIRKDADRELEQKRRGVLLAFLDVLDDLDRALEAARHSQEAPAMVEGVELVRKGFLARLAQFDVSHLPALGQRFDPARHEAVSTVPVSDADKDGVVMGVARDGYLIGDQVLRPAAVAVGRYRRY